MPDALGPHLGTILTIGGSILVAIIGGVFGLWAKFHSPKQPVPIQDIWSENRSLRADLLAEEGRYDDLDRNYRAALVGLDLLWRYVQRIRRAWGSTPTMPTLTTAERRKLAPLIEDIDTPGTGTPVAADT